MRTVDLFSGCGGMSLGFQNAGYDIQAAYEIWDPAIEVYKKNFQHEVYPVDLSQIAKASKHIKEYSPEVIIGGPPCQDFSIAGKRREDKRANLTISFAKIMDSVRPRVFVMENVYNIEKSKALVQAKRILKKSGYGMTSRILDASLTGVPQKRRRYFLVGMLGASDNFFGDALDSNLSDTPMTVHDYFKDRLDTEFYYAHPRSYQRRAVFSVHEPSSTIRRVNRPIPDNYVMHPADKVSVSKAVRPLTTLERSQIQTFPEDFVLFGSKSNQEHLIANAVPVKLAEYVGRCVLQLL